MTRYFAKNPKTLFLGLFGPLYCPTLHPFLGVKEWRQRKNGPHQSESTFHQLFKYEIRFSKSLAVVLDIAILCQVQKPYFYPFLGPFCPKSREREFSQIWDFHRKLADHKTLHFRSFLAKTNDSILRKSPKTLFLPYFYPFWALFALNLENENFSRYGIFTESQPTIRRFILGNFQQKLMIQFCEKSKNPIFAIFLPFFGPILP